MPEKNDASSLIDSPAGTALFLCKGQTIELRNFLKGELAVAELKAQSGDRALFPVSFRGNLKIRFGIRRKFYSYAWIAERTITADDVQACTLDVDLKGFTHGLLEIWLTAFEDSMFAMEGIADTAESKLSPVSPNEVLYAFEFPKYHVCTEPDLYFKLSPNNSDYDFGTQRVNLFKGSSADLLTYFNAFSAVKWAKHTNVKNVSAFVDFKGKAYASVIWVQKEKRTCQKIYLLDAEERGTFVIPIGTYPKDGLLGICISTLEDSILYGGGWLSPDPDTQPVRLGIGITTFKREQAVKAAVARLSAAIAAHPLYSNSIDITVVDNGQTLRPEDFPGAMLIPNKNLGGTGGFTRSLIHYQETGSHTHCLFMDDDASCEAGSIFRSISFIRHAIDPKASLSGAMLFENIQFLQWENGAWFDGGCHSINRDFDLRDPDTLVENEEEPEKRIYGAWWFFLFPLSEVKNYTLPFFVRGDDIDFSYVNDFKVLSMNGVSCWQQDFKTKESPMSSYLFLRSHVVHHLTIPSLKSSFFKVWKILYGHFSQYNNSYMYGTAACVNLAMKHVMQGPQFWEDNMLPEGIFKQVKAISACEKADPICEGDKNTLKLVKLNLKTTKLPIVMRKLTFNGHLLPSSMIEHTPHAMLYKFMTPNRPKVYKRDQVIVLDELQDKRIVLKRDPGHYFRNLAEFSWLSFKMFFLFGKLRKEYANGSQRQRTRNFWKAKFCD